MIARGWQRAAHAGAAAHAGNSSGSCCATRSCDGRARSTSSAPGSPAFPPPCGWSSRACASTVYEATNQAGGRCRSYHDPALGMTIDNGNHLAPVGQPRGARLSRYDRRARSSDRAWRARVFRSSISQAGERWTLRANDGRIAVVDLRPQPPRAGHARARLSVAFCACCAPRPDATIGDVIDCKGPLYDRLLGPLLLAALNTEPPAGLRRAGRGGDPRDAGRGRAQLPSADRARRPVGGLRRAGAALHRGERRQRRLRPAAARLRVRRGPRRPGSISATCRLPLRPGDAVVLAVPPVVAASLVPGLDRADRIPRHRQRPFPPRAAGRTRRR